MNFVLRTVLHILRDDSGVKAYKKYTRHLLDGRLKYIKVRPHYAARHTAAKCGKAARQKLRHATSICGRCVGMPFDAAQPENSIGKLSGPSKEAARQLMNKGFQNGISQFEKKSHQVRRSRFTVLVT